MLFKKLKLVSPWLWKHITFPGRQILTPFLFLPFKTFFMLKILYFIFRNWNLWFWKRHKIAILFQLFKSLSSENVQDFEMIHIRAKLLAGRVSLARTVQVIGTVRVHLQCRNPGMGTSKRVLTWACKTSSARRILFCWYNCTCPNN